MTVQRWGPVVLIMLVIFMASATPSSELPSFGAVDFLVKKGGHMLGYALLALALILGLGERRLHLGWIVMGMVILYACSDEFHQLFVAGRTSRITDVMIDAVGGGIGYLSWISIPIIKRITGYMNGFTVR